jgi:hypothetical protein
MHSRQVPALQPCALRLQRRRLSPVLPAKRSWRSQPLALERYSAMAEPPRLRYGWDPTAQGKMRKPPARVALFLGAIPKAPLQAGQGAAR